MLTHRIAYLIEEKGVNPYHILAITFTNKAAGEMRERVDKLVGFGSESIWVSTFHSACVRILRRYIDRLGYENKFTIYDTDDQKTLMKEVCKRLNVDTKVYKERNILAAISKAKEQMVTPEDMYAAAGGDFAQRRIAQIYENIKSSLRKIMCLILMICCFGRWSCFEIIPMCWNIIKIVFGILWWTSIRIQIQYSFVLSACLQRSLEISVLWGMMISPFTNFVGRI